MPPINHILETAIYASDLDQAEAFYRNVMGLEFMGRSDRPNRGMWFKVGDDVLLIFNPDETLKGDTLPAHGTRGPGHFAFAIQREDLDEWRKHLQKHGVTIEKEVDWPKGGKSLYFRDPAGNAVELVTPGCWGLPSGW